MSTRAQVIQLIEPRELAARLKAQLLTMAAHAQALVQSHIKRWQLASVEEASSSSSAQPASFLRDTKEKDSTAWHARVALAVGPTEAAGALSPADIEAAVTGDEELSRLMKPAAGVMPAPAPSAVLPPKAKRGVLLVSRAGPWAPPPPSCAASQWLTSACASASAAQRYRALKRGIAPRLARARFRKAWPS